MRHINFFSQNNWAVFVAALFIILPLQIAAAATANYNILDYGAVGNGTTLNTISIQSAIDACAQKGGGTVYFPAGTFLSGTLYMKNNVTLSLASGAVLLGSKDVKDYPLNKCQYVSGTDRYVARALIWGEALHDIAITGRGTIDGQGSLFVNNRMPLQEWQKLPEFSSDSTRYYPHPGYINRPYLLRFVGCRNVLVEGVTLQKPAMWLQHYLNCDYVTLRDLNVFSHGSRNNDMIDIDGSRNVVITGCFGDSDDDGITLKSTSAAPVENVTISDCIIRTRTNGIKAGTESSGGFRDITITNCTIQPSAVDSGFSGRKEGLAGIALEIVDGGTLDGVTISNITIKDMAAPIFLRLGNRGRPFRPGQSRPPVGTFRNVNISNLVATNAGRNGCSILGIKGHPIENVVLENVRINFDGGGTRAQEKAVYPENDEDYPESTRYGDFPAYGFFCRHVQGLTLRDVSFDFNAPEARPALICDDVRNLKLFNFDARVNSNAPAGIVLRKTHDVFISGCRPLAAGTFLRLEENSDRIALVGNDLSRVKKPVVYDETVDMSALSVAGNLPDASEQQSLFSMLAPLVNRDIFGRVTMRPFAGNSEIRFTLDGSEPTRSSSLYTAPFQQIAACKIKARVFQDELASRTAIVELHALPVSKPHIHPADIYFFKSVSVILTCTTDDAEIYYTMDGSEPLPGSRVYRKPLLIKKDAILRVRAFRKGYRPSPEASARYKVVPFHKGVQYRYYVGKWEHLPDFFQITPTATGVIKHFRLDEVETNKDHYALLLSGFVRIDRPGDYTFYCGSNDGSVLYVDDTRLIDNDDLHGYQEMSGKIHLDKGPHRIEVRYFQGGGVQSLKVLWQGPGLQKKELEIID